MLYCTTFLSFLGCWRGAHTQRRPQPWLSPTQPLMPPALPSTTPHPHPQIPKAVRNLDDLETMAVPQKYRQIMTFYKYYSGEAVAPVPTLFSEFGAGVLGG